MTVPLRLAANQSKDAQVTSEQRESREDVLKKIISASLREVDSRREAYTERQEKL